MDIVHWSHKSHSPLVTKTVVREATTTTCQWKSPIFLLPFKTQLYISLQKVHEHGWIKSWSVPFSLEKTTASRQGGPVTTLWPVIGRPCIGPIHSTVIVPSSELPAALRRPRWKLPSETAPRALQSQVKNWRQHKKLQRMSLLNAGSICLSSDSFQKMKAHESEEA